MKRPRGKLRKWTRRVLIAGGLSFAALLAAPFVFTGALVRYGLARSPYRDLPMTFRSATLNPGGTVTLHDVKIPDGNKPDARALLSARTVRVTFAWGELFSGHIRLVAVEDLNVALRAGESWPARRRRRAARSAPPGPAVDVCVIKN